MTFLRAVLAFAVGLAFAPVVVADDAMDEHAHHHHHMMAPEATLAVSNATYTVPDVNLVRDDGTPVTFRREVDDGRPVVLDFIYTTCTAICPLTSQTFSEVQARLKGDLAGVHLMSVSIDPDEDTPTRLHAYAAKFHAGPNWTHYTGRAAESIAIQKAFGVYRGDKMYHSPVTFVRLAPGQPWVRMEGFASASDIEKQLHPLMAAK